MKARVHISLKNGVLDPQGKAISNSLHGLGFDKVLDARQGKTIELDLADMSKEQAEKEVDRMCQLLLANTVIENYSIDVIE